MKFRSLETNFFEMEKNKKLIDENKAMYLFVLLELENMILAADSFLVVCDDKLRDHLCQVFNLNDTHVRFIIKYLINDGYFDKERFEKYGLLTSVNLQLKFYQSKLKQLKRNKEKLYITKSLCLISVADKLITHEKKEFNSVYYDLEEVF